MLYLLLAPNLPHVCSMHWITMFDSEPVGLIVVGAIFFVVSTLVRRKLTARAYPPRPSAYDAPPTSILSQN